MTRIGTPYLPAFTPGGLTGATAASRYVGATTSGAPVSGTFAVGDYIVDQTGEMWVCTTAGSPGTWSVVGSGVELAYAAATSDQAFTSNVPADLTGASITFTVGSRPVYVHAHIQVAIIATAGKYLELQVTDATPTLKRDTYMTAGVAADTVTCESWERIATPGTYTRKMRCGVSNTFSVTVYGASYPDTFIRAITA